MNCIRCGKHIPAGRHFCDECAGDVSTPLKDSPFLNTHVRLTGAPLEGAKKDAKEPQTARKKKARKPFRKGRWIAAVSALACLCLLLGVACFYCLSSLYSDKAQRERNRLSVQAEQNERLRSDYDALSAQFDAVQEDKAALQQKLVEKDQELKTAQNELTQERQKQSVSTQSAREIQTKNQELLKENGEYEKKVQELNDSVAALEGKVQSLDDTVDTLTEKNKSLQKKSDFIDAHVVFIENDGTGYYHTYSCSRFKRQSYWAYSTNLAIHQGYKPCPDCDP